MVMPTGCGERPECVGCGALCFSTTAQRTSVAFDLFRNATGLSSQSSADLVFPHTCADALHRVCSHTSASDCPLCCGQHQHDLRVAGCSATDCSMFCSTRDALPGDPPQCPWPTAAHCIRGAGNDTINRYKSGSPQAASEAACCDACFTTSGCKAWQLITRAGADAPECWTMATAAAKVDSPDSCVSGATPPPAAPTAGLVHSADATLTWADVQPHPPPAPLDWSALIGACKRAHAVGGKLILLLWTGPMAPLWIYNHSGIEMIAESYDGTVAVPNYKNPRYQALLKALHTSMAETLRSLGEVGRSVIAIQPCVGSTGDDTPIHITDGTDHRQGGKDYRFINYTLLDAIGGPGTNSSSAWWPTFFQSFAIWLAREPFRPEFVANEMVLLLNAQGSSFSLPWIQANAPGSYLKFGQAGHEYQSNYERYRAAMHVPYMYQLQKSSADSPPSPVRARAELSGETCWTTGPFSDPSKCPAPWNFLAMSHWIASAHLDFWNVQPISAGIMGQPLYVPIWKFLNRYSGLRWPWQAKGAWIAFRDGLDAMDTIRFPESTYGELTSHPSADGYPEATASPQNVARANAICAENRQQGCKIDQNKTLGGGPMTQRRMDGMNDVAFGNWRSDYGNFMQQISSQHTQGWWRVGSQTELFGRFARGWADPSNASSVLALKLDQGLWGGLPLSRQALHLTLRLVFFDRGTGTFSVGYDAADKPRMLARVLKTNTGKWKELCQSVTDARFGGSGPEGADVWITNADAEDDIFSSMEIAEGGANELSFIGCDGNANVLA